MTVTIPSQPNDAGGTSTTPRTAQAPGTAASLSQSAILSTHICVLNSRFTPDADVVGELSSTAHEIGGIVTRLIPNNALPEPLKDTFISLFGVLYSRKDRKWPNYPAPSLRIHAATHKTAQLLNTIAHHCSLRFPNQRPPHPCRQWIVTDSSRTLPNGDSTQSVGIALVDSDRVTKVLRWSDVVCDVQIAADAELMLEALRRLHSGAASVFAAQATRMYHVGLALAGDLFQLAYYDRSGCILSGAFDIHREPGPFLRAVLGLSLLDDSYVGKDTSIVQEDGRRYLTVGGIEYEIVELLSFISDILCKGTICWRCRRRDTNEQFVIKNKWTALTYRPSEGDFLRKAAGIDGVVTLVCEEKVLRRDGLPQSTTWLREGLQGPQLRKVFEDHPKMELRRFVLQPCGRPLQDFESKDELLGGFTDSIKAHKRLYAERDILHCDISDNNLMIRDRGAPPGHRGLLVDLDGAAFVEYHNNSEKKLAPIAHDVGTLPFMACELLAPNGAAPHAPWHDLESFLYVLMSICATCSGPNNTLRPDFDIEESPMGPWYAGDIRRKEQVMCEYDDDEFRTFLDELFDPYFYDLKELVVELREVLTRMQGLQASHSLILKIFDRHIKEREDARANAAADSQRDESPPAGSPTGSKRKLSSRDEPPPPTSPRNREGNDASETSSLFSSSSSSGSRSSHDSSHASDETAPTPVSSKDEWGKAREDDSEEGSEESKVEVASQQAMPPLKRRRV